MASLSLTSTVSGAPLLARVKLRVAASALPAVSKPGTSSTSAEPTVYDRITVSPSRKSPR